MPGRIGRTSSDRKGGSRSRTLIEAAFKALRDAGATVVDLNAAGVVIAAASGKFGVLLYKFKNDVAAYFATRTGVPVAGKTLAGAIAFKAANAATEIPFLNQDIFDLANSPSTTDPNAAQDPGRLGGTSYNAALDLDRAAGVSLDQALSTYDLGAIVLATDNPPWPTDLLYGDHSIYGTSSLAAGPR